MTSASLAAPAPRSLGGVFMLGAIALAALATLYALTREQPLVALAVPLGVVALYALYRLPLKVSVLGVLGIVLACEGLQFGLGPHDAWVTPVLGPVASAMFFNLSTLMGGGPLRAPLIDLITLTLFVVSMVRVPRQSWAAKQPTVRALHMALWASAACALALIAIGTLRGGNFDESLWQVRQVLLFPVRAVVLMRAFELDRRDLELIGQVLVSCALVKAVVGLWVFYVVAPATGIESEFTTSHTDTLLFVPVLAMFGARVLEAKTSRAIWSTLLWAPLVLWGLVANDRRISYVSLAIGAVVMLVMCPPTPVKRVVGSVLLLLTPAIPFYLVAGWTSDGGGVFFPVGILKSLVVGEHRFGQTVDYRDLENLDVLYTWSRHPIVPQGFGQKMELLFPLPDISSWFPSWQYHPHNSLLWLFALAGPIGFTVLMLPHVVTLYLAARSYRMSHDVTQRVALLTVIATVIAFFNQVWGDMGTLSWTPSWMAALAAAVAAKLAMKTGAWPSVLRVRETL